MKKTKRVLAIILSLAMLAIIIPQTAFAVETDASRYEEVLGVRAIVKDAEVHVYTTKNAGVVELTRKGWGPTFSQGLGFREYTAKPADGWVWKGWTYEQLFNGRDLGNRTDLFGMRYSFSNSSSYWGEPYQKPNATISVNRLLTTLESTWNKLTYNVYANFNPTITATADNGGSITDGGRKEVEYGESKTYTITADEGKEIDSITVDGKAIPTEAGTGTFSYTFINITEPHTIHATFKNKTYDVSYEFISGTANKQLPGDVTKLQPETTKVAHGKTVTAVKPNPTSVKVSDGVWTFKGYKEDKKTVTGPTKFTGTWTFAKFASVINSAPTITAKDREITVGDKFNPLEGVTANDKEDGPIKDVKIAASDVNPSQAGTYHVTFMVTDKNGASTTKTITVTVKEAPKNNEQPKDNGKVQDNNQPKVDNNAKAVEKEKPSPAPKAVEKKVVKSSPAVKTGDNSNLMLLSMASLISFIGVVMTQRFKKRKSE